MAKQKLNQKILGFFTLAGITTSLVLPGLARPFYYPPSSYFQPSAMTLHSDDSNTTVMDVLAEVKELKTLQMKIKEVGLTDSLKKEDYLTIFAPTEQAFQKLPISVQQKIAKPENLKKLLQYHLVLGKINEEDIKRQAVATVLTGNSVEIIGSVKANKQTEIKINNATAQKPLGAKNGAIIPIDSVLIPPGF